MISFKYFEKNISAVFNLSLISELNYTFYRKRSASIFFSATKVPIAPKDDGGYYLAYQNYNDQYLNVVEFDSKDKMLKQFKDEYEVVDKIEKLSILLR